MGGMVGLKSVAASAAVVDNLGKVQAGTVSEVADLLAATESVGDDDREWGGGFDCGEKVEPGDGFGELKFAFLKAEGASHAAAGGLDELDVSAGLAEQSEF